MRPAVAASLRRFGVVTAMLASGCADCDIEAHARAFAGDGAIECRSTVERPIDVVACMEDAAADGLPFFGAVPSPAIEPMEPLWNADDGAGRSGVFIHESDGVVRFYACIGHWERNTTLNPTLLCSTSGPVVVCDPTP